MKEALKGILGSKKARRRGGPSLSICAAESLSWGFLQRGSSTGKEDSKQNPKQKDHKGGGATAPLRRGQTFPAVTLTDKAR